MTFGELTTNVGVSMFNVYSFLYLKGQLYPYQPCSHLLEDNKDIIDVNIGSQNVMNQPEAGEFRIFFLYFMRTCVG